VGFKRDREKERLKKHHRDQKIAKTRKLVVQLHEGLPPETRREQTVELLQSLSVGHIKIIVNNPDGFNPSLHPCAVDALTEKLLKLERER